MGYSESDTRANYIDKDLERQGRKSSQIEREYSFSDGRILPGGKRGKKKYVDYLLKDFGLNLGIIEAKKEDLPPTEGLEQVKGYGKSLGVRRVYTSNGHEIYERDMNEGTGKFIDKYPSPEELYERYTDESAVLRQQILSIPYYQDSNKKPRYYQDLAIQRVLSAIAKGKQRILLTMATGTGKTYVAFQIVYKLLQAKWNKEGANRRPRILFLADRNVLIKQAINTFNPIEKDCKWIRGVEIKKALGQVPTNGNVFFSIYQAIISGTDEDADSGATEEAAETTFSEYYKQYDPNFFDLVIIDECHRGGAKQDGNWGEILKYFSSAVQLGMTATPKRQDNNNTYRYFGNPVYEYSLKEGINDGFLSPYKVKRIRTNLDELVIDSDVTVVRGEAEKQLYKLEDFDREIVVPERRKLVAQEILKQIRKDEKTIIFCVDQEHALGMRDAINEFKEVKDNDYCVRITSNEGEIGRMYLERFQDNDKTIPTIVTSSQMLTTGVDARNVRNIVLCRNITSMTEFKQIIGRGTRVFDGKDYFTIIDFTGASELFYDEDWDGPNMDEEVEEGQGGYDEGDTDGGRKPTSGGKDGGEGGEPNQKLVVRLNNSRELKIIDVDIRYIDGTGKPMGSKEYLEMLVGKLPELYADENQLRELWSDPKTREDLLKELDKIGLDNEHFETLKRMFDAPDSDFFDILTHLSFGEEMKTKEERAQHVLGQGTVESIQNLTARNFVEYLLRYYAQHGSTEIVQSKLGDLIKLFSKNKRSIIDFTKALGGPEALTEMWKNVQMELFKI